MKIRYFLFVAIHLIGFSMSTYAQTPSIEMHKIEVAYIYSFAKNIEWPERKGDFNILVVSTDPTLQSEFDNLSSQRSLSGRKIVVSASNSPSINRLYDLIFVSQEFNASVRSIFDQISRKGTLLVTENYEDLNYTMINFSQEQDETLGFKMNRENINAQGLQVLPEVILLGGSKVEVAQLYREAKDSLRILESSVRDLENRYDSIFRSIERSRQLILTQRDLIDEQTDEIESKQGTIEDQQVTLDSLLPAVTQSSGQLDSITAILRNREQDLANLQDEITRQSYQLEEGSRILKKQEERLDEQIKEINERESNLEELGTVVNTQKNALYVAAIFTVLVIILTILIYRAYRFRRRDAAVLRNQKEELSELLDELKEAQTQLVQSEKMASLGVLTAGIAHEINNAINFVYSGIQIIDTRMKDIQSVIDVVLQLNSDDPELHKHVEDLEKLKEESDYEQAHEVINQMIKNIHVGAKRTTEIVNGLRTFSREETLEQNEVDIHADIEVALLLLKNRYKNNIEIEKKFAKDLPIVMGYPGQLGQVFLNLISNAIDAIEEKSEGGKITIETLARSKEVEISITDNGTGIDQHVIDKIFDPFFSTKKVGTGTGLGLSITYGIVERHGGTIHVSSEKNAWTKFSIRLPLK